MEPNQNRYTRLKAIKEFGFDINWDEMRTKNITIAGVGGLGMISAEMFARCGVKTLYLFDRDIIEIVNLNRLGFHEQDLGKPKVEVLATRIQGINPDVKIEMYHGDIMLFTNEDNFEECVKKSDLVLMGLDNYPARMFVNQKCINNKKILVDAGVSRSGLSGHIHPIFPGINACLGCTGLIQTTGERGEPCTASLPTTMAIIAGLQVQESLKILLKIGDVVDYLSYNAITGQFFLHKTKKDPNCHFCSSCGGL
jgi:molybdopterin/thiamine biosynthesis adenylyltransferase